jgi:hypothetical protein
MLNRPAQAGQSQGFAERAAPSLGTSGVEARRYDRFDLRPCDVQGAPQGHRQHYRHQSDDREDGQHDLGPGSGITKDSTTTLSMARLGSTGARGFAVARDSEGCSIMTIAWRNRTGRIIATAGFTNETLRASMAEQRPASLYVGHHVTPMERFPTRRAEPDDPKPADVAGETVRTMLCRSESQE